MSQGQYQGQQTGGQDQFFWGVDCGSSEIKVCVSDSQGQLLQKHKRRTLFPLLEHVHKALEKGPERLTPLDERGHIKPGHTVVATGYGRHHIKFINQNITEIKAHKMGVQRQMQLDEPYTIVDIGGQDSKIIQVNDSRIGQFVINRKCAAGTGAYIEELAHRLEVPLGDLNEIASDHDKKLTLNSYCTVFSGQEVIKTLMNGEKLENLIYALYSSVVQRVLEMTSFETDLVVLTGGVLEFNPILLEIMGQRLPGKRIALAPNPQFCGALGALYHGMDLASASVESSLPLAALESGS
jgi:predicted CoA-substrate-specific enzyme activase